MNTYATIIAGTRFRYYYDTNIRMWAIYPIDNQGNQRDDLGQVQYYPDRKTLSNLNPTLDFKKEDK